MKKYSTLLVVVITILFVALLSWLLPVTYLNGELIEAERNEAGILNLLGYPMFTFYNFIYAFLYLLGIGGIYGLLNKTGAYYKLLNRIADHVKNRKLIWLIVTVLLIAIMCSFTGFTFEMLIILPFIAGIVLMLGYDKMTALMVTIGSISVGIIGTTFSKLVAGTFNSILSTTYKDLVIVKLVLLIVCAGILIFNIIRYTKKTEMVKENDTELLIPTKSTDKDVKVWPLVVILSLFFLTLIVSSIDWSGAFNIQFFVDLHSKLMPKHVLSKYVVFSVSLLVVMYNIFKSILEKKKSTKKNGKFMSTTRLIVTICFGVILILSLSKIMLESVFNVTNIIDRGLKLIKVDGIVNKITVEKLLGKFNPIGSWSYNDYFPIMIIAVLAIKFVYHVKFVDALDSIGEGFRKVLYASIVVVIGYTVLIVTSSHPVILTALKPLLNLTDGLSILTYPICTFVSALANSDFTYYQYGVLNLSYATSYFNKPEVYPLCGLITQSMYGFALLLAPTSSVMLFGLSLFEIRYTTWLKKIWLMLLELLVVIFITYVVVLQFMV